MTELESVHAYKIVFREGPTLLVSSTVNHITPLRTVYIPGEWASNQYGPLYCFAEPPAFRLSPGEQLWECEADGVIDARVVLDYGFVYGAHGPALVRLFHGDRANYKRDHIRMETDDGLVCASIHYVRPILMAERLKLIRPPLTNPVGRMVISPSEGNKEP